MVRPAIDPESLTDLCRRYRVARLSLFGSALRDDFTEASDIDFLVEFLEGARVGLMDLAGLELELAEILGRTVHLSTPGSLSRYFRDEVLRTAVVQYVAA